MFLKKKFSLYITVINLWKQFFFRVQFLYFTKVVAANHSSMDTLFLRRALATISCIYKMYWQIFLFNAYFYFKGTLTAIHLSGTTIILGGHLQWSSTFKVLVLSQALALIPIFKGIELIRKSSCSHPFNELPFFYWKRAIAATRSFKFIVFLQNRNCSKEML